MDPKLKFADQPDQGAYNPHDYLAKLLYERRKMPKAERIAKFRNDSIDEVDTTDLENWEFKGRNLYYVSSNEEGSEDYSNSENDSDLSDEEKEDLKAVKKE